jgi:hypothetical protein
MRAALENDLSTTAKRVVRLAEAAHWSVVGVVSTDTGTGESVLSLRGQRRVGGARQRFVVLFVDGSVDGVWWATRAHRAVVKGYRREDRWATVNSSLKMQFWGGKVQQLQAHIEHDVELDEVVEWTTEHPTFVKLPNLAPLVGVASRGVAGLLEVGSLDSIVT